MGGSNRLRLIEEESARSNTIPRCGKAGFSYDK